MKKILLALCALFAGLSAFAGNVPTSVAIRSGTYTLTFNEYQKCVITQAKCNIKKAGEPDTSYKEISVTGSFADSNEAIVALNAKIHAIYGATSTNTTPVEFVYGGWEANGQDGSPIREGKNSVENFEEWKNNNPSADVQKIEPGLPCDGPDGSQPDSIGQWIEANGKVARQRSVTKYYKFSFTITYK